MSDDNLMEARDMRHCSEVFATREEAEAWLLSKGWPYGPLAAAAASHEGRVLELPDGLWHAYYLTWR